jgi:hypothetical protein
LDIWTIKATSGVSLAPLTTAPRVPRAGKRLTAWARVTTPATTKASDVKLRCLAHVAAARARVVVRSTAGGVARCTWLVPGHTAGERLRATVEATYGGETVQRRFSRRISQ